MSVHLPLTSAHRRGGTWATTRTTRRPRRLNAVAGWTPRAGEERRRAARTRRLRTSASGHVIRGHQAYVETQEGGAREHAPFRRCTGVVTSLHQRSGTGWRYSRPRPELSDKQRTLSPSTSNASR
ncbi:unnamed protein product [Ixodes persulcatus]